MLGVPESHPLYVDSGTACPECRLPIGPHPEASEASWGRSGDDARPGEFSHNDRSNR